MLVIHGDKDKVGDIVNGQAIYDQAPGPKRMLVVPGAGHLETLEGPTRAALVRFFLESLGDEPDGPLARGSRASRRRRRLLRP